MNLIADKFEGCKDMDEVKKAIKEVREMAKRKKLNNRLGNLGRMKRNSFIRFFDAQTRAEETCRRSGARVARE